MRRSSSKLSRRTLTGLDSEALRLLLIEDNGRHAQLLREALGDAGAAFAGAVPYELAHVTGMGAALDALAAGSVDVALLDLSLPDAHGLDALLRVRELYPDVPVIALIGQHDGTLAGQAIQAGAQDYITKGKISGSLLARSIRYAVQINRLQVALRSLSFIDNLTSLYNRRGFVTLAEPQLRMAQRTKTGFLVGSADVAGLAKINAAAGADEGDTVLRETADILRRTFRDSDLIARLEGGAYAVLAPDATLEKAPIIVARMQQHLATFNGQTIRSYTLAVNLGFTPFDPAAGTSIEDLMARAVEARRAQRRSRPSAGRSRVTE